MSEHTALHDLGVARWPPKKLPAKEVSSVEADAALPGRASPPTRSLGAFLATDRT
jgi:hypothetical protein